MMTEIEANKEASELDLLWINGETFYQLRQIDALWVEKNPGRFTIDTSFTGMSFLKSLLIEIAGGPGSLDRTFDQAKYAAASKSCGVRTADRAAPLEEGRPRLLLLDEPFGALDPETRATMQALFQRVAKEHSITSMFVTHDLEEALLMGDRYAHLDGGRLFAYPDRQTFPADPESGAAEEIRLWSTLSKEST
jgi:hypothetical protein